MQEMLFHFQLLNSKLNLAERLSARYITLLNFSGNPPYVIFYLLMQWIPIPASAEIQIFPDNTHTHQFIIISV